MSLAIYIKSSAFQIQRQESYKLPHKSRPLFNEGQETLTEQLLRQRMKALINLFDKVGLRPKYGMDDEGKGQPEVTKEEHFERKARRVPNVNARQEVVGDGEVVDVEEEGSISEGDLNTIYRKSGSSLKYHALAEVFYRAQANQRTLEEMDPSPSFTLSLRGYQKQALL